MLMLNVCVAFVNRLPLRDACHAVMRDVHLPCVLPPDTVPSTSLVFPNDTLF